ncbi:CoA protein activase [Candidatus Contubernalis alkaliaceticus]|uniref:CoA protein activase n=1 Tax=Candidatus Contubernalis alkaliaceticus TaxID=338645 RepID=UPI001F4C17F9|nr:CoA protein activase [Candidatus Contubernalis alkalaceticus]UNC92735.1 CoA protein activase [Candidatus Contubernalis alkalaceticus]
MKTTYAHMGTSSIVFQSLLEDLGHEVIVPPQPTKKTLSLGTQYSPEFACIPFKIVLGNYLETLPKGVDTIVSGGGKGPCRAGYYGELHIRIIRDLGYDPEMIFFWPPLKTPIDFMKKVKRLKGNNSWKALWHYLKINWEKLKALDDVELGAHQLRPRELKRGEATRAMEKGLKYIKEARTMSEILEARESGLRELAKVAQNPNREVLKIGIIGEIYVQLEPFVNFTIEETLGNMGAVVRRSIFLTQFMRDDVFATGSKDIKKLAAPYLSQKIGGHGQNSIGETVHYAAQGYDGVIQLAPFTCIPEIVAKSIMPKLSRDLDIPVLTLFIDEQTGKTGVETRLEAFIDLLWQKKRQGQKEVV